MKVIFTLLSFVILFTGCAGNPGTGQRVAIDSLATGGGGMAAYYASGKDPSVTTAGAVGGFVVSEAFQAMARNGRTKAYLSGIEEGKAIGQEEILHGLWEESNGLPPRNGRYTYQNLNPVLNVPARIQNGVKYDSHIAASVILQPEKILIPTVTTTNGTFNTHYEKFQNQAH